MRVLVVGAGAVGQVYGRHLARGGAELAFLVKPEHADECRAGLTLYSLNRSRDRRAEPELFADYRVLESLEAVAEEEWDQVYLAISSTALREGSWFARLARAAGDSTMVLLQPGPEDRDFVLRRVRANQVVQGIITIIAYRAPLPGETRFPQPGVAYWIPPLSHSPLSGTSTRVSSVVESMRSGGLPARTANDVPRRAPFGGALLISLIAALERAGWRFDELRRGEHLTVAVRASRQAMQAVAHHDGRRPPLAMRLVANSMIVRAALRIAPLVVPFDLETYLRIHFTKVGEQTRDMLRTYLEWGRNADVPVDALARLSADI